MRAEALGVDSDLAEDDDPATSVRGRDLDEAALTGSGWRARVRRVEEGGDLLVVEDLDVRTDRSRCCSGRRCGSPTEACTPSSAATASARRRCSTRSPGWSSGVRAHRCTTGSTSPACRPNSGSSSGITLMSAGRSIFPTLTVEENLWMGAFPFHEHRHAGRGTARRRARRVPGDAPPARPDRRHAVGRRAADGVAGACADGRSAPAAASTSCRSGWRRWSPATCSGSCAASSELGTTVIIVEQSVAERAVGRRHGDVHGQGDVVPVGNAADLGDGAVAGGDDDGGAQNEPRRHASVAPELAPIAVRRPRTDGTGRSSPSSRSGSSWLRSSGSARSSPSR